MTRPGYLTGAAASLARLDVPAQVSGTGADDVWFHQPPQAQVVSRTIGRTTRGVFSQCGARVSARIRHTRYAPYRGIPGVTSAALLRY